MARDLLVFDDSAGRWGPMTARRPAFLLRTGAATNLERIERVLGQSAAALQVPPRLAEMVAQGHRKKAINGQLTGRDWLVVNGRWLATSLAQMVADLDPGHALVQPDGQVLAASLRGEQAQQFFDHQGDLPPGVSAIGLSENRLLQGPWSILDQLPAVLAADLKACQIPPVNERRPHGVTIIGKHPIHVGAGASVSPSVVIDASAGAVVIDQGAQVGPLSLVQGPSYLGPGTRVAAQATIRAYTAAGPQCRLGGEISFSIIQGFSNKSHAGFLGHSLVGEWCNLGAGTTVSNLKNTYGNIRLPLDGESNAVDTKRQFHGPVIGDFVRTAIGTRLLTGAVIGVGCMLALSGFAPGFAAPFGFYTDQGRADYEIEKLLGAVRLIMARRDQQLSAADEELLRRLHADACSA